MQYFQKKKAKPPFLEPLYITAKKSSISCCIANFKKMKKMPKAWPPLLLAAVTSWLSSEWTWPAPKPPSQPHNYFHGKSPLTAFQSIKQKGNDILKKDPAKSTHTQKSPMIPQILINKTLHCKAELIFVTNITNYIRGEKICHVEIFQLSMLA